MAANKRKKKEYERVYFPSVLGGTIVKWEVSVGEKFSKYKVLAICVCNADDGQTYQSSIEAKLDGVIKEVLVPAGNILESSESSIPIATVDYCAHEATFENLCAKCGRVINSMEKRADYLDATNGRKITLAKPQADIAGKLKSASLFSRRKLIAIIDLDHTVVHATAEPIFVQQILDFAKEIDRDSKLDFHVLNMPAKSNVLLCIKLRPLVREFFERIKPLYEMHIYTNGSRDYAEAVAKVLDPDGTVFHHRIVSRSDCHVVQKTLKKNLSHITLSDPSMTLIVDDTVSVWGENINRVIQVEPYLYFPNKSEVNNPAGKDIDSTIAVFKNNKRKKERNVQPSPVTDDIQNDNHHKRGIEQVDESNQEANKRQKISLTMSEVQNQIEGDQACSESKDASQIKENFDETTEDPLMENTTRVQGRVEQNNLADAKEMTPRPIDVYGLPDEHDGYLLDIAELLEKVHAKYYEIADDICSKQSIVEKPENLDVCTILSQIRCEVLNGVEITLSSILPSTPIPSRKNDLLLDRIEKCGALYNEKLEPSTTHLVAAKEGTQKFFQAKERNDVWIVRPEWLHKCIATWKHKNEMDYLLIPGLFPTNYTERVESSSSSDSDEHKESKYHSSDERSVKIGISWLLESDDNDSDSDSPS